MHTSMLLDRVNYAKPPSVGALSRARAAVALQLQGNECSAIAESLRNDSTQTQLRLWDAYQAWCTSMDAIAVNLQHHGHQKQQSHSGRTHKRPRSETEVSAASSASSSAGAHIEFQASHLMALTLYNAHANLEEEAQSILTSQFQRTQMEMVAATAAVQDLQALRELDGRDFKQRRSELEVKLRVSRAKVSQLRKAMIQPGASLRLALEDD